MISVVIPLYNKEKSIAATLQTVLNQTFTDYEIVIVNDGSTDNSVAEVEKVQDARIRLIHQQNGGVSAARNRGIKEAKGDLIAFLDADDEWKPEYLATQYHLSQKYSECSVFTCNYEFRNVKGEIRPTVIRKLPFCGDDGILSNYFEVACYSNPPICSISIMVNKLAIQTIGGFPVGIKSGEDLLTWARLASQYKIAYSTKSEAIYNLRQEEERPLTDLRRTAPVDLTSTKDRVGVELQSLYMKEIDSNRKSQIALYIAFWYKMRAVINLNLNYRLAAIRCSWKAIIFNWRNIRAYILILLALFSPYCLTKKILK